MGVVQRRLITGGGTALAAEIFSDGPREGLHGCGVMIAVRKGTPDAVFLANIFIDSYVILVGMLGCRGGREEIVRKLPGSGWKRVQAQQGNRIGIHSVL